MIKNKLKSQKGITIISLIITIIIILILTGTTVYTINISNNNRAYNNMKSDIKQLEDKILIYYNKYQELPIDENWSERTIDDKIYYKIDLSKFTNLTLNYGTSEYENDIYLLNSNLEVYYYKGIEKSGEIYH